MSKRRKINILRALFVLVLLIHIALVKTYFNENWFIYYVLNPKLNAETIISYLIAISMITIATYDIVLRIAIRKKSKDI